MTTDLLSSVDISKLNDTSATDTEACDEQVIRSIDKITGIAFKRPLMICLPFELLGIIFLEYAQQFSLWTTRVPPWVAVSYVCRHWRNAALGCASLWARLFFVSPEWMDELLVRSKAAPLFIHVDFARLSESNSGPIRSFKKALGCMGRVQELWVDCSEYSMADMIQTGLTAAAPLLQSLRLSLPTSERGFVITKNTLPGAMPGLREVHLEPCHMYWASPIFDRLTMLSLNYVLNDTMECWDGLLLILSQSPCLRGLRLENIPTDFDDSFMITQNVAKVSLPHLEKLTLTDPIPWVAALLNQLEFPRSTLVQLGFDLYDSEEISLLIPFITDKFGSRLSHPTASIGPPLRSLDFRHDGRGNWAFEFGTTNYANIYRTSTAQRGEDLDSRCSLRIEFTRTNFDVFLIGIAPLFDALPVEHLNIITMHSELEGNFDSLWTDTFWDAPELEVIEIGRGCANMLIHVLQPCFGVIFAPTLTDIAFRTIPFDHDTCEDEESHEYGIGCLMCLRSALAGRAEAGVMLQRLHLDRCTGIRREDIAELSKVVGRLEWTPPKETK